MQSLRVLFLLALFACASAGKLRKAEIVTKGELQGTACSPGDYERYNIIVCGETLQKCTYEWCDKYIHSWKKKFGACVLKGCSA